MTKYEERSALGEHGPKHGDEVRGLAPGGPAGKVSASATASATAWQTCGIVSAATSLQLLLGLVFVFAVAGYPPPPMP